MKDSIRKIIVERSGGLCEMATAGCWGRATDISHRVARKQGGRHGEAAVENDRPSNLIHACRPCHEWAETREQAKALGLRLEEHQDPARVDVLLLRHDVLPVYLDDRGGWHPYEEAGT